jgi:hypothetical protein
MPNCHPLFEQFLGMMILSELPGQKSIPQHLIGLSQSWRKKEKAPCRYSVLSVLSCSVIYYTLQG